MAIVNISFDSVTKECNVTVDGNTLPDVRNISIYKDGEKPEMYIHMDREDVDGFRISTSLYAEDTTATDYLSEDKTLVDTKSYVSAGVQQGLAQLFK